MRKIRLSKTTAVCGALATLALVFSGCVTANPVHSSAVTDSLSFADTNRFTTEITDTSLIDTAFSTENQKKAHQSLISNLESEGFNYVGARNPDIKFAFSTYVTTKPGHIDTSKPVIKRVIEQEGIETADGEFVPTQTKETITTAKSAEPIYLSGPARVFILDVIDSESNVTLWRGYTSRNEIGLDEETLSIQIDRLVKEFDSQT